MNKKFVAKELKSLNGKEIQFVRLAGNTIILYFNGEPGEDNVTTLRIDPSWRYSIQGTWLLASGEIPWEKEDDESQDIYDQRWNKIESQINTIARSKIVNIEIGCDSSDLTIDISGNKRLVSFSPFLDESDWVYNNRANNIKIYASLNGFE